MIFQTKCNKCKKQIRFYSFAVNRFDLSKPNSKNTIRLKCRKCGDKSSYDLNLISAESNIIQLLALVIFVVATPLIIYSIWDLIWEAGLLYGTAIITFLVVVPNLAYGIMIKNSNMKKNHFNDTRI